jgi:L,D-transpeptidase YcbB
MPLKVCALTFAISNGRGSTPMIKFNSNEAALRGRALMLLTAAVLTLCSGVARAQDIRMGPVGDGPGNLTTDREFIKQWEGNPPPGFPTLASANIAATKAAIKRYEEIVKAGGWGVVPELELKGGQTHYGVGQLRQRLLASGELDGDSLGGAEFFDGSLETAVKRFQATNGLTPTGILDKRTAQALNVPADWRLKQLKVNVGRLQQYSGLDKKRYVVVNVPSAQVEAVEGTKVVTRYAGVVGKTDRPTPLLRSAISQMNFNPVWRLPPTVINKDLIPRGREMQASGKNVLTKFGIDAYDGSGKKLDPDTINWAGSQPSGLSYSQQPGKENPLGFLKINFDSADSVYMHDTPSEGLFGRNFRAASSGCIRVHNIQQLAEWLLRDTPGWTAERIQDMKESGKRQDVTLKKSVPLYFTYITAWATPDGAIQFRRDLYNRDGIGETAGAY